MRIGEFAEAVGTRISVLRYYDKERLIRPVFIDKFTGYRYYDETQIMQYNRIAELKNAGFSLGEIRSLLDGSCDVGALFERKKSEFEQALRNLERIKDNMSEFISDEAEFKPIIENIDLPFENDEKVVGKWELVSGDVNVGGKKREIYFLPDGERYWCYGWTKGKLLYDDGCSTFTNDYTLEEHSDGLYMIIRFKSYDYLRSGKITPIALKKIDSKRYSAKEISRKDNIEKPFRTDERLIGKWKARDYILTKDEFSAERVKTDLYFKEAEFLDGGACSVVYGDEIISENSEICWSKGYLLRKWNSTACAYEIRNINGTEYMIIEWKSGDYRFGGMDTDYYVLVKE